MYVDIQDTAKEIPTGMKMKDRQMVFNWLVMVLLLPWLCPPWSGEGLIINQSLRPLPSALIAESGGRGGVVSYQLRL